MQVVELNGTAGKRIPVFAYWAPDDPRPASIFGGGWRVPFLESRCAQSDRNTLSVWQPDGYVRDYKISTQYRNGQEVWPKKLSSSGWRGVLDSTGEVKLQAECGAQLVYKKGRLREMTVSGNQYSWNWTGSKLASIKLGEKTLLTLNWEDSVKNRPSGMTCENGDSLSFQYSDTASVAHKGILNPQTITTIKRKNREETSITYTRNNDLFNLKLSDGDCATVDCNNGALISDNQWRHYYKVESGTVIQGRIDHAGLEQKWEVNQANGITRFIDKDKSSHTEQKFTRGQLANRIKSVVDVDAGGQVTNYKSYTYDEHGRYIKIIENQHTWIYEYNDSGQLIRLSQDGKVKTENEYKNGRIVKLKQGTGTYYRLYPDDQLYKDTFEKLSDSSKSYYKSKGFIELSQNEYTNLTHKAP